MSLDLIDAPSPNFGQRLALPELILLHYTGMPTGEAALERMRDPAAEVSAHYMVEEDGRIFRLVAEERRAWHAGRSFWRGETDINSRSIGIEIVNPGHEFGYRAFPDRQVAAVIALISDIRSRWEIADHGLIAHSDVAPARKEDPGELFCWKALAEAGHGLWVEPLPAPGPELGPGDQGLGVHLLQSGLRRLGYDCEVTGIYDDATRITLIAFQRHWVQSRIDGIADGDTRARLMALLRLAD